MAIITKGKLKGQVVQVEQFCNNWFSVSFKGQVKIVSPLSLQLTDQEQERVMASTGVGFMWTLYTLSRDGIFKKRKKIFADGGVLGRRLRKAENE